MKQEQNKMNGKQERFTRYLLQLCVLPLFLAMVGSGCKQDAKVAADINPVGTYTLASVDGNKVTCTLTHEGHTMTVQSGTFIINAEGTCSSKMAFSLPSGGDSSREVKATYTRRGSQLVMKWEGAGTTTGTVESDTFTMNNEGMIFAYQK